jgi:glycosyltransferase involved in cell wall biosynthesis
LKILLLTQTNPQDDNRVLKCHKVALGIPGKVLTVGIERGKKVDFVEGFVRVKTRTKPWVNSVSKNLGSFRYLKILVNGLMYLEIYLKMFIRSLIFSPQIIHANDWHVLPLAVVIKKITRAKILYDAHELESQANGVSKEMSRLIRIIERKFWKDIDIFVTVSSSIASWYEKEYGWKKTVLVLNSPEIDTSGEKKWQKDYYRKKFDIKNESIIFLYMGALEHGRGIEMLLNIFEEIDQKACLVFMGSGSLNEVIISSRNYEKNIFLHSPVPHDQITSVASSADIGLCLIENVSLSDFYCLPNKFFDYIFSNLPVVASNFPDMSEMIEKYSLGCVVENSENKIKNLISDLMKNDSKPLLKTSKNFQELGWTNQATHLRKAYLDLKR